jgi:hypothetical protein
VYSEALAEVDQCVTAIFRDANRALLAPGEPFPGGGEPVAKLTMHPVRSRVALVGSERACQALDKVVDAMGVAVDGLESDDGASLTPVPWTQVSSVITDAQSVLHGVMRADLGVGSRNDRTSTGRKWLPRGWRHARTAGRRVG